MSALGKRTLAAAHGLPRQPSAADLHGLPRKIIDAIRLDAGEVVRAPEIEQMIGKLSRALTAAAQLGSAEKKDEQPAAKPSGAPEAKVFIGSKTEKAAPARELASNETRAEQLVASRASSDPKELAPAVIEDAVRRMILAANKGGAREAASAVGECLRELMELVEQEVSAQLPEAEPGLGEAHDPKATGDDGDDGDATEVRAAVEPGTDDSADPLETEREADTELADLASDNHGEISNDPAKVSHRNDKRAAFARSRKIAWQPRDARFAQAEPRLSIDRPAPANGDGLATFALQPRLERSPWAATHPNGRVELHAHDGAVMFGPGSASMSANAGELSIDHENPENRAAALATTQGPIRYQGGAGQEPGTISAQVVHRTETEQSSLKLDRGTPELYASGAFGQLHWGADGLTGHVEGIGPIERKPGARLADGSKPGIALDHGIMLDAKAEKAAREASAETKAEKTELEAKNAAKLEAKTGDKIDGEKQDEAGDKTEKGEKSDKSEKSEKSEKDGDAETKGEKDAAEKKDDDKKDGDDKDKKDAKGEKKDGDDKDKAKKPGDETAEGKKADGKDKKAGAADKDDKLDAKAGDPKAAKKPADAAPAKKKTDDDIVRPAAATPPRAPQQPPATAGAIAGKPRAPHTLASATPGPERAPEARPASVAGAAPAPARPVSTGARVLNAPPVPSQAPATRPAPGADITQPSFQISGQGKSPATPQFSPGLNGAGGASSAGPAGKAAPADKAAPAGKPGAPGVKPGQPPAKAAVPGAPASPLAAKPVAPVAKPAAPAAKPGAPAAPATAGKPVPAPAAAAHAPGPAGKPGPGAGAKPRDTDSKTAGVKDPAKTQHASTAKPVPGAKPAAPGVTAAPRTTAAPAKAPDVPAVKPAPAGDAAAPRPGGMVQRTVSLDGDRSAAASGIAAESATQKEVPKQAQSQTQSQVAPLGPMLKSQVPTVEAPARTAAVNQSKQGAISTGQQGQQGAQQAGAQGNQQIAGQAQGAAQERAQIAGAPPPGVIAANAPQQMTYLAQGPRASLTAASAPAPATQLGAIAATAANAAGKLAARKEGGPPEAAPRDVTTGKKVAPVDTTGAPQAQATVNAQFLQARTLLETPPQVPQLNLPTSAPAAEPEPGVAPGGAAGQGQDTRVPSRAAAIANAEANIAEQMKAQAPAQLAQGHAQLSGEARGHLDRAEQANAQTISQAQTTADAGTAEAAAALTATTSGAQAQAQAEAVQHQAAGRQQAQAAQQTATASVAATQASAQAEQVGARAQRDAGVAGAKAGFEAQQAAATATYSGEHAAAQAGFNAQNQAAQTQMTAEQAAAQQVAQAANQAANVKSQNDISTEQAANSQRQATANADHQGQVAQANAQATADQGRIQADMDQQVQATNNSMQQNVSSEETRGQQEVNNHLQQGERHYHAEIQSGEQKAESERQKAEAAAAQKRAEAESQKDEGGGGIFGTVINWVKARVNDLLDMAKSILEAARAAVMAIMEAARAAAMRVLEAARSAAMAALNAVKSAIQGLISAAAAAVRGLISAAASLVRGVIQALSSALQGLVRVLTTVLNTLVEAFQTFVNFALDALVAAVSLINEDLGRQLDQATQGFRQKFNAACDGLQQNITAAGARLEAGIQAAADKATAVVDSVEKNLNEAVTAIENKANQMVDQAFAVAEAAVNAAFDAVEAGVNAAFDAAEAVANAAFDLAESAVEGYRTAFNAACDAAVEFADKALTALGDLASAFVDLLPDSLIEGFIDFWNGPWRSMIIIGLATIAAVAITVATGGIGGPIAGMLLAGLIGGTLSGGAYLAGELVARQGAIDLAENGNGIYVPNHGYVPIGPDGKPDLSGVPADKLQEVAAQVGPGGWAGSNFESNPDGTFQMGPDGKPTGRPSNEIANEAVMEGIQGFGEGFISAALAVGGGGLGAQLGGMVAKRFASQAAQRVVQTVVSGTVEGAVDLVSGGATTFWNTGFDAMQAGKSPGDAFKEAATAGWDSMKDPAAIGASLANIGVSGVKAKGLDDALDSRLGNPLLRQGADLFIDTATETVGEAAANFGHTLATGGSWEDARNKAAESFDPTKIAMSAGMGVAGNAANGRAERYAESRAAGNTPAPDVDTDTDTPSSSDRPAPANTNSGGNTPAPRNTNSNSGGGNSGGSRNTGGGTTRTTSSSSSGPTRTTSGSDSGSSRGGDDLAPPRDVRSPTTARQGADEPVNPRGRAEPQPDVVVARASDTVAESVRDNLPESVGTSARRTSDGVEVRTDTPHGPLEIDVVSSNRTDSEVATTTQNPDGTHVIDVSSTVADGDVPRVVEREIGEVADRHREEGEAKKREQEAADRAEAEAVNRPGNRPANDNAQGTPMRDTGTAANVAGFRGDSRPADQPDLTPSGVQQALGNHAASVLPRGVSRQGDGFALGDGTPVRMRVGDSNDGSVASFKRNPDGSYEITVSRRASDEDVARAVAHELAEINAREQGAQDGPDALSRDGLLGDDATLSAHDHGRLAEINVLAAELAANPGDLRARHELQTLLDSLGLREGVPDADARLDLIRPHLDPAALDTADQMRSPQPLRLTEADVDVVADILKRDPRFKGNPETLEKKLNEARNGDPGALGELEAVQRWLAEGREVEMPTERENAGVQNPDFRVDGQFVEIKSRSTELNGNWVGKRIQAASSQMRNSGTGPEGPDGKRTGEVGAVELQLRGDEATAADFENIKKQVEGRFNERNSSGLDRVAIYKDGVLAGEWVRNPDGTVSQKFPAPDADATGATPTTPTTPTDGSDAATPARDTTPAPPDNDARPGRSDEDIANDSNDGTPDNRTTARDVGVAGEIDALIRNQSSLSELDALIDAQNLRSNDPESVQRREAIEALLGHPLPITPAQRRTFEEAATIYNLIARDTYQGPEAARAAWNARLAEDGIIVAGSRSARGDDLSAARANPDSGRGTTEGGHELPKSSVLPDQPTPDNERPYTPADRETAQKLREAMDRIAEIDARHARRDQQGDQAASKTHGDGDSAVRTREVAEVRRLLEELQLGGTDQAYNKRRLDELATVVPDVDIRQGVSDRIANRQRAEQAHAQANEARARNAERQRAVIDQVHAGDPPAVDRLVIGSGMAGLTNAATLPGSVDFPGTLMLGSPDPIGQRNPGAMWGQRTGAYDNHPLFGQDGAGSTQKVVEDAGEYVHIGELNDAMDIARDKLGVAPYPGTAGAIEPRNPNDTSWPDNGYAYRVPVTGPDGTQRFIYANSIDVTSGPGGTRMPNPGVLSPDHLAELRERGDLIGGNDLLNERGTGEVDPDSKVFVYSYGFTGAWAARHASADIGAGQVDWGGSNGTKADNDRQRDGTAANNRTQDAFGDPNIQTTTDPVVRMRPGDPRGVVVTFNGPDGIYDVHYNRVTVAMGFDTNSGSGAKGDQPSSGSLLNNVDLGLGTDGTPILQSEDGKVRVMGPAAGPGPRQNGRDVDQETVDAFREAQAKVIARQTADSPSVDTAEFGGMTIDRANRALALEGVSDTARDNLLALPWSDFSKLRGASKADLDAIGNLPPAELRALLDSLTPPARTTDQNNNDGDDGVDGDAAGTPVRPDDPVDPDQSGATRDRDTDEDRGGTMTNIGDARGDARVGAPLEVGAVNNMIRANQASVIAGSTSGVRYDADSGQFVLPDGRRVTVEVGTPRDNSVASFEQSPDGSYTITVSNGARDQDVVRAIAHEVAEINANAQVDAGTRGIAVDNHNDRPDRLTTHLIGRYAEMRVLVDQIDQARRTPGASDEVANLRRELDQLIDGIGMGHNDTDADGHVRINLLQFHDPALFDRLHSVAPGAVPDGRTRHLDDIDAEVAGLPPHQRDYYAQILADSPNPTDPATRAHALKKAQISRPLTPRDRQAVRAAQELMATMNAEPTRIDADGPVHQLQVTFDGTWNNRDVMPDDTNPALLNSMFGGAPEDQQYQVGVGTGDSALDRGLGGLSGRGISQRIDAAYQNVVEQVNRINRENQGRPDNDQRQPVLIISGFSRGSTAARAFVNELNRRGIPNHEGAPGEMLPLPRVGAMVLFDTVGSVGIPGNNWNPGLDLSIPANAENVLHLTAGDEQRRFFPLSRATDPRNPDDPRITEVALPGDHSDVGGSHPNAYSRVSLELAHDYLTARGVNMNDMPNDRVDVDDERLRLHETGTNPRRLMVRSRGRREYTYNNEPTVDRGGDQDRGGTMSNIGEARGDARVGAPLEAGAVNDMIRANHGLVTAGNASGVRYDADSGQFVLPNGRRVTVEVGTPRDNSVASFEQSPDGSYAITVSSGARDQDVVRALAHEIAEINANVQVDAGARGIAVDNHNDRPDRLTTHLIGRFAEIRVLVEQMNDARQTPGGADRVAAMRRELDQLIEGIGMGHTDTDADAHVRINLLQFHDPALFDRLHSVAPGAVPDGRTKRLDAIDKQVAGLPEHQRDYYAQILAESPNPTDPATRKHALKKAQISRPLTEHDRQAVRAAQELVASMQVRPIDANGPTHQLQLTFDGTWNNRDVMPDDTNPALINSMFNGAPEDQQYQVGVGTGDSPLDRGLGGLSGHGISQRIDAAYQNVVEQVNRVHRENQGRADNDQRQPVMIISGFSRGSTAARAFVNELNRRGIPNTTEGREGETLPLPRIGVMVLFDTVGSVGIPGTNWNPNLDLSIPANAENVLHLTAGDEQRRFFPLSSAVDPQNPNDPRISEVALPGDHSDVGGSHPNAYSRISLEIAHDYMTRAGASMADIPHDRVDVDDPRLRLHETGTSPRPLMVRGRGRKQYTYDNEPTVDRGGDGDRDGAQDRGGTMSNIGDARGDAREGDALERGAVLEMIQANQALVLAGNASNVQYDADSNEFVLPNGRRISVEVGTPRDNSVASFDETTDGTGNYTITVSSGARDQDVVRAIAHEIAEININMQVDGGRRGVQVDNHTDRPDRMTTHLAGRFAEIRVLVEQMAVARQTPGASDQVAALRQDLDQLIAGIGMSHADTEGNAHVRINLLQGFDPALFDRLHSVAPGLVPNPRRADHLDETDTEVSNLPEHQRDYYAQILAGSPNPTDPQVRKDALDKAKISRPLSEEDRQAVRAVQESLASMQATPIDAGGPVHQLQITFDGTWNNRAVMNDDTNPAILNDMFRGESDADRDYQVGVGTGSTRRDRYIGGITGRGIDQRIDAAYRNLVDQVNRIHEANQSRPEGEQREPVLVISGFSRGSTAARAFVNHLNAHGIPNRVAGIEGDTLPTPRVGVMVLFDTVSSVGIPGTNRNRGIGFHRRDRRQLDLSIPANVDNVLHITADGEQRRFFPLSRVTDPRNPNDPRITEVGLPGDHSDIGGSHPNAYSRVSLELAHQYLEARNVPMAPLQGEPVDLNDPRLRLHETGATPRRVMVRGRGRKQFEFENEPTGAPDHEANRDQADDEEQH